MIVGWAVGRWVLLEACLPCPVLIVGGDCVAVKGWTAKHTGLPCFRLTGAGSLVESGSGRVLAVSDGRSELFVADPFAPVGVTGKYKFGGSTVSVKRTIPNSPGSHCGLVTDLTGRGVMVDLIEDNGDPRRYKTGGDEYPNGVIRFGGSRSEFTGETVLVLDKPDRLPALYEVLSSDSYVLLVLGGPAAGVEGVREVWVTDADFTRGSEDGSQRVVVSWKEPAPVRGVRNAPVLSWGELEAAGAKWDSRTFESELVRIAGMPR